MVTYSHLSLGKVPVGCVLIFLHHHSNSREREKEGRGSFLSLGAAEDAHLLLSSLEATVAELGGSVNELELDLLEGAARGLGDEGAAQGDGALDGAGDGALYAEEGKK